LKKKKLEESNDKANSNDTEKVNTEKVKTRLNVPPKQKKRRSYSSAPTKEEINSSAPTKNDVPLFNMKVETIKETEEPKNSLFIPMNPLKESKDDIELSTPRGRRNLSTNKGSITTSQKKKRPKSVDNRKIPKSKIIEDESLIKLIDLDD